MARLNEKFRSHESPMDFQWTDRQGPVSKDSPFAQAAPRNGQFTESFAGQKRSASFLDSPTKVSLPQTIQSPSFELPRTPQRTIDTDFSSGPEQSSPANADSEATPDPPARGALSKTSAAMTHFENTKSEKKLPSQRLFTSGFAPGRGEIARPKRRIEKRRRTDLDKDVRSAPRRSSHDSDSEERPSSSEGPHKKPPPVQRLIPSVLTFIDEHPNLPSTLSYYVQFLLNCFFAFCLMYVLYGIYSTIRNDIDERAMMESSEILAEMAFCAREFKENRCERDSRVPAMETVCNNWEKCMQRDPLKVGRSRLSAGMFAEIFNSFIEPISMKAMIVSIVVIVGCFAVNNLTFGLWRARTHHYTPPHPPTQYMHPPPLPPPATPSQWQAQHDNGAFFTPQHRLDWQMPGMIGHGGFQVEGQSPSKRIEYRR